MNEVTCAGASRDSRWQCVDCDDGHGNGIWFVFAPEDAVVLRADVVAALWELEDVLRNNPDATEAASQASHILADRVLALLPKPGPPR